MTNRGAAFLRMLAARGGMHAAREARRGGNRHTRRLRRVGVRPQRHPDAIARTYFEAISKLASNAREEVRRRVMPLGPALVAEAARLHGDSLVLTLDSPAASTSKIFRDLSRDFFGEFTNERLASVVRGYGTEISDFQRREVARQFEQAVGFDPFKLGEPWLQTRIEGFTAENVALIRTIPERYFSDIETNLIRELRAGTRWEEIAPLLEDRYGVSESNAERIARDQAGKFFGELNRARQQDVGIAEYTWRTARDNRVRDSHAELEGTKHSWDDPPPDTGHPGDDINCRCQGEPDVSTLLEALGEQESPQVEPE